MKYLVPAGALLLGFIAFAWRFEPARNEQLPRIHPVAVEVSEPVAIPSPARPPEKPERVESEKDVKSVAEARSGAKMTDPGLATLERSSENVLYYLQQELDLSPSQAQQLARLLFERQKEFEAYFRDLRISRVFRGMEFERKVQDIREDYYRKMGVVLDPAQHAKYSDLLVQGKLSDTTAFEITPDMVVID